MKMKYFFDTYAIIEIIRKNSNYKEYFSEEMVTSILNLGEFYLILLRGKGMKLAETWFKKLKYSTLNVDLGIIKRAMVFRFRNKNKNFSFIDCVGYLLAKENGLVFLTGDMEFKDMDNVEYVKKAS